MTSFKLVALICTLLVGSFVVDSQRFESTRCGRHQHFVSCGQPIACQRSCFQSEERTCVAECISTCICDSFHLRDRRNRCILPQECKRSEDRIFEHLQ